MTASAMGEHVFEPALGGKKAQTIGRPDTLHSYSYVLTSAQPRAVREPR